MLYFIFIMTKVKYFYKYNNPYQTNFDKRFFKLINYVKHKLEIMVFVTFPFAPNVRKLYRVGHLDACI